MGKGLENVHSIYLEGIAGGKAREAVTKYTGHRYTQHSTGVGDGVEGFLAFFEPFLERNPKRDIRIIRSFQDGPWVFCNAYQSLNDGEAQWVTMDMFYTDPDGLILEHWDTIAPFIESTKSGENMIEGVSEVDTSVDSEASKSLVREYVKQVMQEGKHDKLAEFIADDITQRAPTIGAGRAGLAEWLASEGAGQYEMLFHLMGHGDMVLTYGKRHAQGKDIAVFDLYRVVEGKIAEQWQNAEEISPRDAWGNSGKF